MNHPTSTGVTERRWLSPDGTWLTGLDPGDGSQVSIARLEKIGEGQRPLPRPSQIEFQRAGHGLWNTGINQFAGGGNITGIGGQKFYYDKVGRLAHAEILPQACFAWVPVPDVMDSACGLFGNMNGI